MRLFLVLSMLVATCLSSEAGSTALGKVHAPALKQPAAKVENFKPEAGWLGVQFTNVDDSAVSRLKLKEKSGALVGRVLSRDPADLAGMKPDDVVVGIDDRPIPDALSAVLSVGAHAPGTTVNFKILRDGKQIDIKAVLASRTAYLRSQDVVGALIGDIGPVTSIAVSNDGQYVLAGSDDQTLRLWDLASGRLVKTFSGHTDSIRSVAFSPDDKQILSGSLDGTLKLWDVSTGMILRTFVAPPGPSDPKYVNEVFSVAFSPDGTKALSGGGRLRLWDIVSGRLLQTFEGHSGTIFSVAFSPDGKYVASSSSDRTIKTWGFSGQIIHNLNVEDFCHAIAFSPDSRFLLSGCSDGTVKIWTADETWSKPLGKHGAPVKSVVFSRDGRFALSGADDHTMKLWDAVSWQLLRSFDDSMGGDIQAVALSPDARLAFSGGWNWRPDSSGHASFPITEWNIAPFTTSIVGRPH